MLPLMAQAWADTTGALWSSRTMMARPLSRLVSLTPGGSAGISGWSLAAGAAVAVIGAEIAGKRDLGAWCNLILPSGFVWFDDGCLAVQLAGRQKRFAKRVRKTVATVEIGAMVLSG